MDPITLAIAGPLAGAVVTLAGIIFKMQQDQLKEVKESSDRLRTANEGLQVRLVDSEKVNASFVQRLDRIIDLVEDTNDSLPARASRSAAPRRSRTSGGQ